METIESVQRFIRRQTLFGLVVILAFFFIVIFNPSTELIKWIFPSIFLFAYLKGIHFNAKIYRNPENSFYSSTLRVDDGFLIVRNPSAGNCRNEKRIRTDRIKSIKLIRRSLTIRLKGIALDFETRFSAADKEKLRRAVDNIGKQSGIEVITK